MESCLRCAKHGQENRMLEDSDKIESQYSTVPDAKDLDLDVELGVLMMNGWEILAIIVVYDLLILQFCEFRLWKVRRVAWTKNFIAFANVGENSAFDAIPFTEILSIDQINEEPPNEGIAGSPSSENYASSKSADAARTLFRNALQIKTNAEGYNSGRTYYLQAASPEQCSAMCASLTLQVQRARKAVVAGRRILRLQGKVLRAYESLAFQSGVAILIIAVRPRNYETEPHRTET